MCNGCFFYYYDRVKGCYDCVVDKLENSSSAYYCEAWDDEAW
jgi:hypothetical protein